MKNCGTRKANPTSFDRKINLTRDDDNILNLHVRSEGRKVGSPVVFEDPTPQVIDQSGICVRVGKVSSFNKAITVTVQKDIATYVMGTH